MVTMATGFQDEALLVDCPWSATEHGLVETGSLKIDTSSVSGEM